MKRIAAKFKKRLKRPKIVYQPNPKSHIPHTISMPTNVFYEKFEHHLQNNQTIVPVVDDKLTWKLLVKYNPTFIKLKLDIIKLESRNFPDKAWDNVANRLVRVLKQYHESVIVSKKP